MLTCACGHSLSVNSVPHSTTQTNSVVYSSSFGGPIFPPKIRSHPCMRAVQLHQRGRGRRAHACTCSYIRPMLVRGSHPDGGFQRKAQPLTGRWLSPPAQPYPPASERLALPHTPLRVPKRCADDYPVSLRGGGVARPFVFFVGNEEPICGRRNV